MGFFPSTPLKPSAWVGHHDDLVGHHDDLVGHHDGWVGQCVWVGYRSSFLKGNLGFLLLLPLIQAAFPVADRAFNGSTLRFRRFLATLVLVVWAEPAE